PAQHALIECGQFAGVGGVKHDAVGPIHRSIHAPETRTARPRPHPAPQRQTSAVRNMPSDLRIYKVRMRLRWVPALIVAAGLAACSSATPVSSPSPSAPPPVSASASGGLCTSWNDLKTAVSDLQKIDVVAGGTNAIQTALADVQTKFDAFHNAARDQFSPQIQQMSDALSKLQQ